MKIDVTFLRDLDNGGHEKQPQQVASQLTKFINAAKSSLHVAIYDFRLTKPELSNPVSDRQGVGKIYQQRRDCSNFSGSS